MIFMKLGRHQTETSSLLHYKGEWDVSKTLITYRLKQWQVLTFDMYIPGSSGEVPNGTQKWSDPPIILSPSGPPSLYNDTSCKG